MYSGIVYDTLKQLGLDNFVLHSSIKPLESDTVIFGPAFTTKGEVVGPKNYERFDKIRLSIYDEVECDDVVVLAANDDRVAHSGDITSLIYKELGALGFVTDGNVRDARLIRDMAFPCFCAGVNPIDALDYWAIIEYNVPIRVRSYNNDKVLIRPSDYIFGDADGVMRIPRFMMNSFSSLFYENYEREKAVREEVLAGKDIRNIFGDFGRW